MRVTYQKTKYLGKNSNIANCLIMTHKENTSDSNNRSKNKALEESLNDRLISFYTPSYI